MCLQITIAPRRPTLLFPECILLTFSQLFPLPLLLYSCYLFLYILDFLFIDLLGVWFFICMKIFPFPYLWDPYLASEKKITIQCGKCFQQPEEWQANWAPKLCLLTTPAISAHVYTPGLEIATVNFNCLFCNKSANCLAQDLEFSQSSISQTMDHGPPALRSSEMLREKAISGPLLQTSYWIRICSWQQWVFIPSP